MSNEQAAPETKGVTVRPLATVDLGPEIEGMAGRRLRMRMVTIEPGGVFGPIHDHKDRPGIVYMLQGTIPAVEISVDIVRQDHATPRSPLADGSVPRPHAPEGAAAVRAFPARADARGEPARGACFRGARLRRPNRPSRRHRLG